MAGHYLVAQRFVAECNCALRLFGIARGYPDRNDAARLVNDPMHKLMLDRDPLSGQSLASQPTMSRFENAAGLKDLLRMGDTLVKTVIERHRRRAPEAPGQTHHARSGSDG